MSVPTYYRKFQDHRLDKPDLLAAEDTHLAWIDYWESLNAHDWEEFLRDLALRKRWPISMAVLRGDSSLVDYFAPQLNELSVSVGRLARDAMHTQIYRLVAEPGSRTERRVVKICLQLAKLLGWGIDKALLSLSLVQSSAVPSELRLLAATVLATYDDLMPLEFWTEELDITGCPELGYPRLVALRSREPLAALETYVLLPSRPRDFRRDHRQWTLHTFAALTALLERDDGSQSLADLHERMPPWARRFFDDVIFKIPDLQGLKEQLRKPRKPQRAQVSVPRVEPTERVAFNGDLPSFGKLTVCLTGILDQDTLAYAEHLGYFHDFGFETEVVENDEYTDIGNKYFDEGVDRGDAVISLPREILLPRFSLHSCDVALVNAYNGYCLIAPKDYSTGPYDPKSPRESFSAIISALNKSKVFYLDEGAHAFLEILRRFSQSELTGMRGGPDSTKFKEGSEGALIDELISGRGSRLVVGTASILAVAIELDLPVLLHCWSLDHLIRKTLSKADAGVWTEQLRAIFLHNCWNFNIAPDTWEQNEEVVLRLAGIAFATIDCIEKQRDRFYAFLHERWVDWYNQNRRRPVMVSVESIADAFTTSYGFATFDDCERRFLTDKSLFNYYRSLSYFGSSSGDLGSQAAPRLQSSFREVFNRLNRYKKDYEETRPWCEELLKQRRVVGESAPMAADLMHQANLHFERRSYYDAHRYISQARELLTTA